MMEEDLMKERWKLPRICMSNQSLEWPSHGFNAIILSPIGCVQMLSLVPRTSWKTPYSHILHTRSLSTLAPIKTSMILLRRVRALLRSLVPVGKGALINASANMPT